MFKNKNLKNFQLKNKKKKKKKKKLFLLKIH